MASFRYRARELGGAAVNGVIEADSRREALSQLSERGLYPTTLESCGDRTSQVTDRPASAAPGRRLTGRVTRKEVTAFTREMATLLGATIPIPAALEGLGEQEENPALKEVILELAALVRSGVSLSEAMEEYPKLFSTLYTSMIRVGEEAGALDQVVGDLANLLENEDELRNEVVGAVAYPCFVLVLGLVTTFILLVFVMPRLFGMLEGMLELLPLPTRILLAVSDFFEVNWPWLLTAFVGLVVILRWYLHTPAGALLWDTWKLRLPVVGGVFRAAALGRFARTLGILARSGVSLLPALHIVQNTVGNRWMARAIVAAAEDTRGGDSLATPFRKLGLFPPTMVQMIAVGEDTGRLDDMLLRVADMQERQVRGRSRTLVSLLAPMMILAIGALVGFIVISLLLPIFQMSRAVR